MRLKFKYFTFYINIVAGLPCQMEANELPSGFGEFLTSQYEILRRVFSFLSLTDLKCCMEMCKAWDTAALATIRARRGIQCLILNDEASQPFVLSDAALVLRFRTLPDLGDRPDATKVMANETVDCVTNFGVVAYMDGIRPIARRYRVELSVSVPLVEAAVRFSPINGMCIKTAVFSLDRVLSVEEIEAKLVNVPSNDVIKAVLFICYEESNEAYEVNTVMGPKILDCLIKRSGSFAFGGCRCPVYENMTECLKVVVFMGPIQTGSCILDANCRSSTSIRKRLEKFRSNLVLNKDSVLLAFRCCDRSKVKKRYNYQPAQNVLTWESNALKEYFPQTPVIGCYGIGNYSQCSYLL